MLVAGTVGGALGFILLTYLASPLPWFTPPGDGFRVFAAVSRVAGIFVAAWTLFRTAHREHDAGHVRIAVWLAIGAYALVLGGGPASLIYLGIAFTELGWRAALVAPVALLGITLAAMLFFMESRAPLPTVQALFLIAASLALLACASVLAHIT